MPSSTASGDRVWNFHTPLPRPLICGNRVWNRAWKLHTPTHQMNAKPQVVEEQPQ